jgi:hypothetical protein
LRRWKQRLRWRPAGQVAGSLSEGLLGRIAKVFGVELGVCLEPLFWRAVLLLLKIYDEVIEDGREVVLQLIIANNTLCPNKETRAPLGCESDSDGG